MTRTTPALFAAILGTVLVLSGCRSSTLQGMMEHDVYYAPKAAYGIPLYVNPFRGQVDVSERCNASGGSTTFWDEQGRFFRIDYLKIDEHPMAQAPRFASDQTLLNAVLNNYLREILPTATAVEDADISVREFLRDRDPRGLFAILTMNVDTKRLTDRRDPLVRGTYYYGFLLFKRGDFVYVVQHYQSALMRNKMLSVLNRLGENMIIPGQTRSGSEAAQARERWKSVFSNEKPAEDGEAANEAGNEPGAKVVSETHPARPCD